MSKNKTKAELQADLDKAEQEKEAAEKAAQEAEAKAAALAAGADAPPSGDSAQSKPSAKPDPKGTVHFASPSRNYRFRGIQFQNHRFATNDPKVIEQLRSASVFGNEFTETAA